MSLEPHRFTKADYDTLRKHYSEMETFEILLWIASCNDTNRWAIVLNCPLESHRKFLVDLPKDFQDKPSRVAPIKLDDPQPKSGPAFVEERPKLKTRDEVEAALAACRKRVPYMKYENEKATLTFIPDYTRKEASGMLPAKMEYSNWMRIYALFPKTGGYKIGSTVAEAAKGIIDPLTRARISWIAARYDHAWYAVGQTKRRLLALGQTEDQIYALDGDWKLFSVKDQKVFELVRKTTVSPSYVTDKDIGELRKLFTDTQVAELIFRASSAAMLNRIGESLWLPLED